MSQSAYMPEIVSRSSKQTRNT